MKKDIKYIWVVETQNTHIDGTKGGKTQSFFFNRGKKLACTLNGYVLVAKTTMQLVLFGMIPHCRQSTNLQMVTLG